MKNNIVIGLGFGDEGKGLVTDFLCMDNPGAVVVRFNGGHQAGHTVVMEDGRTHTFANFGSGTFRGCPTYWSNFCTVEPLGTIAEYEALLELGLKPVLNVDALCPVTTPYDLLYNREMETIAEPKHHGTVGVGFGATIQRNLGPEKLCVLELLNPTMLPHRLKVIEHYYKRKLEVEQFSPSFIINFCEKARSAVDYFRSKIGEYLRIVNIVNERFFFYGLSKYIGHDLVFEGAQGIMLDMDHGYFPHVTRSNTTSKNAMILMRRNQISSKEITVYYVTRCYQTRHGAGPMVNEGLMVNWANGGPPNENNKGGRFQGEFRTAPLDLATLNYALSVDKNYTPFSENKLVITCMDHIRPPIVCTDNGTLTELGPVELANELGGRRKLDFITSFSPISEKLVSLQEERSSI